MLTRSSKVLLAAADVCHPTVTNEYEIIGGNVGVKVFRMGTKAGPVDIAKAAVGKAKMEGFDTVLSDTAGSQVIDTNLMDELQDIQTSGMCFVFRYVPFLLTFIIMHFFLEL